MYSAISVKALGIALQALAMYTSWRSWLHWSPAEEQPLKRCSRPGLMSAACQHLTSTPLTRYPSTCTKAAFFYQLVNGTLKRVSQKGNPEHVVLALWQLRASESHRRSKVLRALQGPGQTSDELCWQLHPEQLQLAPAAAGLVRTLTSVPVEAEERSLRITPLSGTHQQASHVLIQVAAMPYGKSLDAGACVVWGGAQMNSLRYVRSLPFLNECGIRRALQLSQGMYDTEEAVRVAGRGPAERGPWYISDADQFAKGGFGEVWRATRRSAQGGTITLT